MVDTKVVYFAAVIHFVLVQSMMEDWDHVRMRQAQKYSTPTNVI